MKFKAVALIGAAALALVAGSASAGDLACLITKNNTNPFFVKMKEGAEAVNVGSMPDGRTFAYKIEDGSPRASAPILAAALKKLGITSIDEPVYIHGGGKVVGSIRANF